MKHKIAMIALLLGSHVAMGADGTLVSIPSERTFAPKGFDDNDQTQIVIEGRLANDCYRLEQAEVKANPSTKEIMIQPKASYYNWMCLEVLVPWTQVVNIGHLDAGDWTIKVGSTGQPDSMTVNRSNTVSPDDHVYAPVDSLNIDVVDKIAVATIRGRFATRCGEIQEVKVIDSGKTIEVLPIVTPGIARDCERKDQPFEYKFELPEKTAGRYLVHVRSLNGQALNQVYEIR